MVGRVESVSHVSSYFVVYDHTSVFMIMLSYFGVYDHTSVFMIIVRCL